MIIDQTMSPLLVLLISAIVILFARGVLEELLRNDTFNVKILNPFIEKILVVIIVMILGRMTANLYDEMKGWGFSVWQK